MPEKVAKGNGREKGYLYYVTKEGHIARGKPGDSNAEIVKHTGITRESGYLYYVGKDGDIWRTKN